MILLHLGYSEAWSRMYVRLTHLLLLVGVAVFGRQVSTSLSTTSPSVESINVCHPNGTESCSTSTQSYSSTSSVSSSSTFSVGRLITDMELFQQNLRLDANVKVLKRFAARVMLLPAFPNGLNEYRFYGRVSALEASGCGPETVQCGARTRSQCLSDLFVCDGITDCINGRDEDPHICSEEPVKIGSTYVGFSFWQTCLSRRPHRSLIVLTRSKRSPAFKARVWLQALLIHHVGDEILTHHVTGFFNFARRQIVLLPMKVTSQQDLGVQCLFNRGDHVHLDCKIVKPYSFTQCGSISMARL